MGPDVPEGVVSSGGEQLRVQKTLFDCNGCWACVTRQVAACPARA